jgi:RNA polymerase-interacting CarD/CdnL/TRCF family regulator
MSEYLSNNQKLLQEGVKWVRSEYERLVALQVANLGAISTPYYQNMTSAQLRQIATFRVDEILKALEGGSFDDEAAKQRFYGLLQQGVKLSELTAGADVLLDVFTSKAKNELASQPKVIEALLKKVNYVTQLLKMMMAAAAIEYQTK